MQNRPDKNSNQYYINYINYDLNKSKLKKVASQILQKKIKEYRQSQQPYTPILNKPYEEYKYINPSLKSPKSMLLNNRISDLERGKQEEIGDGIKRKRQGSQRRILMLQQELKRVYWRLLNYEPTFKLKISPHSEYQRNLENLDKSLQIVDKQLTSKYKTQVSSILYELGFQKDTLKIINNIDSLSNLFDYFLINLRPKINNLINNKKTINQQDAVDLSNSKGNQNSRLEEEIIILKRVQKSLKQQLQNIKQNWMKAQDKSIKYQQQNQKMRVQLFQLRKTVESKINSLKTLNKQSSAQLLFDQNMIDDYKNQIEDLSILLSQSGTEKVRLKFLLETMKQQLNENTITINRRQEQMEQLTKKYIRLKSRYQPYQYASTLQNLYQYKPQQKQQNTKQSISQRNIYKLQQLIFQKQRQILTADILLQPPIFKDQQLNRKSQQLHMQLKRLKQELQQLQKQ